MPILTDEERCGTELAGKYFIDAVIGRGGMGVVFKGHHLGTSRKVAIKILRPELSRDVTLSRRFVREARAASKLRHPNVVEVLDLGVEEDGTAYQVLELLEGESLADVLIRKDKLPIDRTLELLLPVMDALAVAHEAGIVHRDLKPDNIFLARQHDGRVRPTLLDFGIAKLVDAQGSFATRTGSVMGTPHFMAPEQARGASDQGPAIDVWAMGVIVWHCISGKLPFEADAPTLVMIKVITERPPRLDEVAPETPPAFVDAVARAMSKDPDDRFPTMQGLVDALRDAAMDAGIVVPRARESIAGPLTSMPPGANETAANETTPSEPPEPPESERLVLDTGAQTIGANPFAVGADRVAPAPPTPAVTSRPARWPLVAALLALPVLGIAGWLAYASITAQPEVAGPEVVPVPPTVVPVQPEPEPEPLVVAEPEPEPEPVAATPAPSPEPSRRSRRASPRVEGEPEREPPGRTRQTPGVVEW